MKPSISIAMAVYNGEKYLREQLDSILAQSLLPAEIIVSDDNSTDKSLSILREYESDYPDLFIILHNEQRLGYIRNFEQTLKYCSTAFIALCDQDDIWEPEKLEVLGEAIDHADLVYSDAMLIDAEGRPVAPSYNRYSGHGSYSSFTALLMHNMVSGCTMLFRRQLLSRAFPFPRLIPHDYWITILAADAGGLCYVPQPLLRYRQHDANTIGAKSRTKSTIHKKKLLNFVQNRKTVHRHRKERYEELLERSAAILKPQHYRALRRLHDYYDSFFSQSLRPGAFFFHLVHLGLFSKRKNGIQAASYLLLSFFGARLLDFYTKRVKNEKHSPGLNNNPDL